MNLSQDNFYEHLFVDLALDKKTVNVYTQVVDNYINFCKKERINEADYESVKNFYISLELNSRTICKYKSALNSYFKYLIKCNKISSNPQDEIDKTKIEKKLVNALSDKKVNEFLNNIKTKQDIKLRDRAIFTLMYNSGLRVSELINIKKSDIDYMQCIIRVVGKRKKERIVPLSSQSISLIEEYIKFERNKYDTNSSPYLFLSIRGDKLTRVEVWKRVKKYSNNLDFSLTPHVLRHSFATNLLENGANINAIKDMLGHASIATTQVYTQLANENIKKEYFRVFNNLS